MHPQQFLVITLSVYLVIIDCFPQTQKTKLALISQTCTEMKSTSSGYYITKDTDNY